MLASSPMGLSPLLAPHPPDWQPVAANGGWTYHDRVNGSGEGQLACDFYAERYPHSDRQTWQRRLDGGEIQRNDQPLLVDAPLARGDRLTWHRPPWQEEAVPGSWETIFDDGDLLALNKPSGLPVLPAGGFLEHTLLRRLERHHAADPTGIPRPVHRLGRFTSGLLLCARRPTSRAWLSARLRESTAHQDESNTSHRSPAEVGNIAGNQVRACRKLYRALIAPSALGLRVGDTLTLTTPIARQHHPRLGTIWAAGRHDDPSALNARSHLTLVEQRRDADLVEVAIASGRPHQIRIHCAAAGAPLLGDPLYQSGGAAIAAALPGEGGYRLHARRLELPQPDGSVLILETPSSKGLWWSHDTE